MSMYREAERGAVDGKAGKTERDGGFRKERDFRIIAVTNRSLSRGEYFSRIGKIAASGVDAVIVREKDMTEAAYEELAGRVMEICAGAGVGCILHTYAEAARRLGCGMLHLPLPVLKQMRQDEKKPAGGQTGILSSFHTIGASVHSPVEAAEAEELGADYVTAGHVFATDCKKGAEPRGLGFLRETVNAVSIPVFAIGGISSENIGSVREAGAAGACIMSQMMKGSFYE